MTQPFTLTVNNQLRSVSVDPDTPLMYVLRNDLGLKGVKTACGLEQCGACNVIVDGAAVPSCQLAVKKVAGLAITTIEGLGTAGELHPLQEAFVEEQAIQCGYCAPGMILAAQALLDRNRYPTDDQIREALADNLCRCGIYDRVRRAVKLRVGRPDLSTNRELREEPPRQLANSDALPFALQRTPGLDSWIRFNADNTVTIFTGKVEYGQGIKTALAQIAAEELDLSLARIEVVMADTSRTPDEYLTVGSMSLETSGNIFRRVAAEARHILLSIAFEELEIPINDLQVIDGAISDPATGRSVTYWQLMGGKKLGREVSGRIRPKSAAAYTIVGQPVKRLDLLAKVKGEPCYVQDLALPGMVHGRVARPPAFKARLLSVDEDAVLQLPGVIKVVRDGSFLAVVAGREEQAVRAMEKLAETAVWHNETDLPQREKLFDHLLTQPDQPSLVIEGATVEDPIPPIQKVAGATQTLTATYYRPYHMHASLAPSAAVALMEDGKLTVWTHSQGVFPPRAALAQGLGLAEANIRVIYMEGSGCYGHNGANDAALDAALLARAMPGRPVSLKWTREDEHRWEPYGPAMAVKMQAGLDANHEIVDWNHDVWSYPHMGRGLGGQSAEPASGLLASWHLARPFSRPEPQPNTGAHSGGHRNADPIYAFSRRRIVTHFVANSPLRTSSLRSLGAYANVFAIESFMDELAVAAGADPLEFRLRYLEDERARAVVEAAAEKAGWVARKRVIGDGRGRGMAFAQYKNRQTYAAVIVELSVDPESGQIQLERAVIAADAGQIVNPDGLSNQLEGGFIQAASWTLKEAVAFDRQGVTSVDWDAYPILRFPEAPPVETVLLNRPGYPFLGGGEAAQGPTPAAIANAVFDAAGIRLRHIPFTPPTVKQGARQSPL